MNVLGKISSTMARNSSAFSSHRVNFSGLIFGCVGALAYASSLIQPAKSHNPAVNSILKTHFTRSEDYHIRLSAIISEQLLQQWNPFFIHPRCSINSLLRPQFILMQSKMKEVNNLKIIFLNSTNPRFRQVTGILIRGICIRIPDHSLTEIGHTCHADG